MFKGIPREKHTQLINSVSIVAELLAGCCKEQCSVKKPAAKERVRV
jgi:hypothetical protein